MMPSILISIVLSLPLYAQQMGLNTRELFEARVRNKMAQSEGEVRESLRVRGVDMENLRPRKDSYRISADRFTDSHLKKINMVRISEQVDEAVRFTNDLYVDTHGNPDELTVREIKILPLSALPGKSRLVQQGETLLIGMPRKGKEFKVTNSEELRALFNQGLQLERGSPLSQVWKHLNPVGETRTQLRNSLQKIRQKVNVEIGEMKKRHEGEQTPDSLRDEILSFIENRVKLTNEERDKFISRLEKKTHSELLEFLTQWEAYVSDPSRVHIDASYAPSGSGENIRDNNVKVFGGLIGWGNQKRVRVILKVSSGGKEIKNDPPPTRDTTRVITTGLLYSHWTEDTIDVTVISTDGGIIHSGLMHALGRLRR